MSLAPRASSTRRGFLARGTVVALGALVATPAPLPALPSSDAELRARLSAVLDRNLATIRAPRRPCSCAACDAARSAAFTCGACGFTGEASVLPCDCAREWEQTVELWTDVVEHYADRPRYHDRPRREYRRWLARCKRGRPTSPCVDGRCGHTARACPVCDAGEGAGSEEAFRLSEATEDVARLFQELRAIVRAS